MEEFRQLLKLQAAAIELAACRLDTEQVDHVLQLLLKCAGNVLITGIGKSGLVARKLAATFTSTGTRAIFLHPSDALHGDLGIMSSADVVMLLSNSGESEEVVAMLPFIRQRAVPLIAIVGNLHSTLARNADALLDASVEKEACPLNLAPTCSTTVALAIGDALAVTLMKMRGFTPENFAVNHPAGRLGKRLTLKVTDLMHGADKHPLITPEVSWLQVVGAISRGGLGAINVVDETGRLVGLITDGDLRRTVEHRGGRGLDGMNAESMMTRDPITVKTSDLAYTALQLMENRPSQISVLPVVDDKNRCVGLLRLHDVVRCGL